MLDPTRNPERQEVFRTSSYGQTLTVVLNDLIRPHITLRIETEGDSQALAIALLPGQLDALIDCLQAQRLQALRWGEST